MDVIGVFICFFLSVNLSKVGCKIIEPGEQSGTISGKASFKWNSSKNNIVEAAWGLCKNGSNTISDKFVIVSTIGGLSILYNNGYLNGSPQYKDRVEYVGNVENGQAWFIIKNLIFEDAGAYCAEIREGPEDSMGARTAYKVILKVSLATTTPIPTTTPSTTPTTRSILNPTNNTANGDNGDKKNKNDKNDKDGGSKPLTTGAIVGIVIGVLAGLAIIGIIVYFVWKKSCGCSCRCQCTFLSTFPCCCPCCFLCCRQRSDQNDGKGDVVLKNKVDKEGNDNTQPTA